MRLSQRVLLHAYYWSTLPWRWHWNARAAAEQRAPLMILFYHRVADDAATPWTTSTEMFARHLTWLQKHFELVSLSEIQERMRTGASPRPAVSITFDDGYADNCRFALPLLIREQIPCTYFVSTHHVFHELPFAHDLARGQRLAPNSLEQLRALAAAGIEIGAHTRTHVDLGKITDRQRLYDELITSGEELQAALRQPVRYFAFPYGQYDNLNATAFHLAYDHGYEAVCSAYGGLNFPGDDAFHLQRIPADDELIRLKNWLTVDPRKGSVRRFYYGVGSPTARPVGAPQP